MKLSSFSVLTSILLADFTVLLTSALNLQPQQNCNSCAPNPLAAAYPNVPTGVINSTTSVKLVSYAYARALIPSQYPILTAAYARFGIPPSKYPLIIETTIDHDVRFEGINAIPDFSSFRISFPFVDRLNNGFSSFRFLNYIYLAPTVPVAIAGAEMYGEVVLPGVFDPPGAGYAITPGGNVEFKVYGGLLNQSLKLDPVGHALFHFTRNSTNIAPFPLDFYVNVTSQPQFGTNPAICDNQLRLWNTSVTTGSPEVTPKSIVGSVKVSPPLVPETIIFTNVHGVTAETAFIENNDASCESLS